MDPRCSRMFKCRIQVIAVAYGTKAPFTLIQLGKRITRENFSLFISSSRCGTCISYGMLSRFVTFLVNYPTNLVLARYFSLLFLAECNFNFIILIIVFFLFFPWIILLCIFFRSFVSFISRCYFIFSSPTETKLFLNS